MINAIFFVIIYLDYRKVSKFQKCRREESNM